MIHSSRFWCRPTLLAVTSTSSVILQVKVNPLALALPQEPMLKGLPVVCTFPNYTFLLSKHTLGDSSGATSCQSWLGHRVLFQQGCAYFNVTDQGCKTDGFGPLHKAAACVIWKLPKGEHTLGVPQVFVLGDLRRDINVSSVIPPSPSYPTPTPPPSLLQRGMAKEVQICVQKRKKKPKQYHCV